MNEDEIKNNPSLKKLRDDAEQFREFTKVWPILKPYARLLGVDIKSVEKILGKSLDLAKQIDEMTSIPDQFNELFSENGWILFESMDLKIAQQAIEVAKKFGINKADEFLAEYFSPDWVESHINWLKYIKGFKDRFELAKLALEDYKAGRFYSSILVVLSLIDGWVSELNIIDFRRYGFFSDKSQLVAWDSIAAHPKGLMKLKEVFGNSRMMTRTEEIRIPHRNGIIHGMDLGYNNKYVAAKCWAALFAVRDWVIKVAKDELSPPELTPEVEKTLWESIESYRKIREQTERLKRWQPRQVIVGNDIKTNGNPDEFPSNTPEQKLVEFLHYWLKNNYGFIAKCYSPILKIKPIDVRQDFKHRELIRFTLLKISEITAAIADVSVIVIFQKDGKEIESTLEFRLVCSNKAGEINYFPNEDTVWGITTWRLVE